MFATVTVCYRYFFFFLLVRIRFQANNTKKVTDENKHGMSILLSRMNGMIIVILFFFYDFGLVFILLLRERIIII